jgi:protein-disulfide isomerase
MFKTSGRMTAPGILPAVLTATALGLGSLVLLGTASGSAASADDPSLAPSSNSAAVATIGHERVTEADVAAQDRAAFDRLEADYQLRLRQLRLKLLQDRHELVQKRLEALLDARALALEAKARNTTTDAVLADIKVPAVTDDEARHFYEDNRARTTQTFEQLQSKIVDHLASEHNTSATRSFYDGLRAKYAIVSLLGPYRVAVDATGPSRGKPDAPVTIVEFGDFQCPYCREAEGSLRTVMSRHPDQVRLIFRNLPLPSLHPNARVAAQAAVCAERQGKFWEMHDAMFENQSALSESALKDTAKRLGLDSSGFSACLENPQTNGEVDSEEKAAAELDITGTPFFLINGRPLDGSVPVEKFEAIIADELRRLAAKQDEMKRG